MSISHLTLITGASRGLGRAMAEQLLQSGHTVLGISRKQSPELAEAAKAAGAELVQWEQDLSDPVAASERVSAWLKTVDAQRFDSVTLIIGLEAPMLITAAFLGATREWRGTRKVLNISSGLGRNAMGSQAPYCAAKAGMDHFSRAVALEEANAPNGARIVSLAPGVIDTDMQVQLRGASADKFPDRTRFEKMKNEGMLDSPAAAATKVLGYLAREDFGAKPVADVRDPA